MRRTRRARIWAAITAVVVSGLVAPTAASAGTLTGATFTTAGTGYAVTGAQNTRYDYGFTTATSATVSRVSTTVPTGTTSLNQKYLALNGPAYNNATTPDSVANSITGDIDVRVKISVPVWPSANMYNILVSKDMSPTNRDYQFYLLNNGYLVLNTSADGSTWIAAAPSTSITPPPNTPIWLRATRIMNNGSSGNTTNFYTSSDGTNWTAVGSPRITAGTTSIRDSNLNLEIGSEANAGSGSFTGKIYFASVSAGINGTTSSASTCTSVGVGACFSPTDYSTGTTFTSSSSQAETWTVNRNGSYLPADIASDLTATGVSGLASGGTASYRLIDGTAVYVLPTPTSIAASTPCTISFTGFTNTATAGSYTSPITTYDNSATPAAIDSATTSVLTFAAASNTTNVSATIDPTLTFIVASHSGVCVTAQTGSATATSVNMGHISSSSSVAAAQDVTVATNAGGALLYVRYSGPLSDGNGHTIANTPGDGSWQNAQPFPSTGTAAFGYSPGWLSSGWIPLSTSNSNFDLFTTGSTTDCVAYRAQSAPTTPAGAYSTTVIYTVVPSY